MDRLVIGITGASGSRLACRLIARLKELGCCEVHAVATDGARLTASTEAPEMFAEALGMADRVYDNSAIGEAIASGTFETLGMVVAPCSMKTAAGIASGYSDNLLLRAADVTIKEQRPLVLLARETPMSPIHLRNLSTLAQISSVCVLPPMLTYYHQPQSIEDMEDQIIGKVLDRFGLEHPAFTRWEGC